MIFCIPGRRRDLDYHVLTCFKFIKRIISYFSFIFAYIIDRRLVMASAWAAVESEAFRCFRCKKCCFSLLLLRLMVVPVSLQLPALSLHQKILLLFFTFDLFLGLSPAARAFALLWSSYVDIIVYCVARSVVGRCRGCGCVVVRPGGRRWVWCC